MARKPQSSLGWLVAVHAAALVGLSMAYVATNPATSQAILVSYLIAAFALELPSWWLFLELMGLMIGYLAITGGQQVLVAQHELLVLNAFYLLIGVVVTRVREQRQADGKSRA